MDRLIENIHKPSFDYDEDADVMYITFGKPRKCKTFVMSDGILHRYTLKKQLNGITIIGFSDKVA